MSEYVDHGPEDRAYDEARVELLNEFVRVLNRGSTEVDVFEWVLHKQEKLEANRRVPPGFELVRLRG